MISNKYQNQNGFTLVEVLIALVLFSIGILAVSAMQITSIGGNTKARRYTEAVNLASIQMETLIALDFDDPLLDDDENADDGSDSGDGTSQDADNDGEDDSGNNYGLDDTVGADDMVAQGNYTIFWNIANDYPLTSAAANNSVKTIRVIVTWEEGIGTKSVSLTNIKAAE